MSSIVAFYGSPRKNGYTASLIEEVIRGAQSAGAEVFRYDLNEEGIKGCQGCYWCRSHEGCATKDLLSPAYEQIPNADGIVVGFPIYFAGISGQAKQWLDRMFPLIGDGFAPRYPGKKCAAIYAQGNADPEICVSMIEENNRLLSMFGWELVDSILCYGNNKEGYKLPEEMRKRAYEAGKNLVRQQ